MVEGSSADLEWGMGEVENGNARVDNDGTWNSPDENEGTGDCGIKERLKAVHNGSATTSGEGPLEESYDGLDSHRSSTSTRSKGKERAVDLPITRPSNQYERNENAVGSRRGSSSSRPGPEGQGTGKGGRRSGSLNEEGQDVAREGTRKERRRRERERQREDERKDREKSWREEERRRASDNRRFGTWEHFTFNSTPYQEGRSGEEERRNGQMGGERERYLGRLGPRASNYEEQLEAPDDVFGPLRLPPEAVGMETGLQEDRNTPSASVSRSNKPTSLEFNHGRPPLKLRTSSLTPPSAGKPNNLSSQSNQHSQRRVSHPNVTSGPLVTIWDVDAPVSSQELALSPEGLNGESAADFSRLRAESAGRRGSPSNDSKDVTSQIRKDDGIEEIDLTELSGNSSARPVPVPIRNQSSPRHHRKGNSSLSGVSFVAGSGSEPLREMGSIPGAFNTTALELDEGKNLEPDGLELEDLGQHAGDFHKGRARSATMITGGRTLREVSPPDSPSHSTDIGSGKEVGSLLDINGNGIGTGMESQPGYNPHFSPFTHPEFFHKDGRRRRRPKIMGSKKMKEAGLFGGGGKKKKDRAESISSKRTKASGVWGAATSGLGVGGKKKKRDRKKKIGEDGEREGGDSSDATSSSSSTSSSSRSTSRSGSTRSSLSDLSSHSSSSSSSSSSSRGSRMDKTSMKTSRSRATTRKSRTRSVSSDPSASDTDSSGSSSSSSSSGSTWKGWRFWRPPSPSSRTPSASSSSSSSSNSSHSSASSHSRKRPRKPRRRPRRPKFSLLLPNLDPLSETPIEPDMAGEGPGGWRVGDDKHPYPFPTEARIKFGKGKEGGASSLKDDRSETNDGRELRRHTSVKSQGSKTSSKKLKRQRQPVHLRKRSGSHSRHSIEPAARRRDRSGTLSSTWKQSMALLHQMSGARPSLSPSQKERDAIDATAPGLEELEMVERQNTDIRIRNTRDNQSNNLSNVSGAFTRPSKESSSGERTGARLSGTTMLGGAEELNEKEKETDEIHCPQRLYEEPKKILEKNDFKDAVVLTGVLEERSSSSSSLSKKTEMELEKPISISPQSDPTRQPPGVPLPIPNRRKTTFKTPTTPTPPTTTTNPIFSLHESRSFTPLDETLEKYVKRRKMLDEHEGERGDLGVAGAVLEMGGWPEINNNQWRAGNEGKRRVGKAAWWLDVQCPGLAEMRELKKYFGLHPLTVEDILQGDSREKLDVFDFLGYYFVVFRALDEQYFRWTSSSDPKQKNRNSYGSGKGRKKGKVKIIEGLNGQEGIEGIGVGAVNIYLVIFADGIISFHFDDISKHAKSVQGKIRQFGLPREISSHWIAYGLMDSIVDAFFPIIDFLESECDQVDDFLVDPFHGSLTIKNSAIENRKRSRSGSVEASQKYNNARLWDPSIIAIRVVENPQPFTVNEPFSPNLVGTEDKKGLTPPPTSTQRPSAQAYRTVIIKRREMRQVLSVGPLSFSRVPIPARLLPHLSERFYVLRPIIRERLVYVDSEGKAINSSPSLLSSYSHPHPKAQPFTDPWSGIILSSKVPSSATVLGGKGKDKYKMLRRIVETRKLISGISRLLEWKAPVVRRLRKRSKEHEDQERLLKAGGLKVGKTGADVTAAGLKHDIGIYLGDLQDHVLTMQQMLNFYEATLAHDHPLYLSVLRITFNQAKMRNDKLLVSLAVLTATFFTITLFTGMFSMNANVPHNGDRENHLEPDGSPAPHNVFWSVCGGVVVIMLTIWSIAWRVYEKYYLRKGVGKGWLYD